MSTDFNGLLQSHNNPSTVLRITLVLSDENVEMFNDLGFIGRWNNRDVSVTRSDDHLFRLKLDEDEWDFRPDDPTAFFLAAPLSAPEPVGKRPPLERGALSKISKLASGAVLAVVLLTIGIVIGRYQLDGTQLGLTNVLVLAAALGAGWASIKTSGWNLSERRDKPSTSLRINGPRTPLRVEDVLRGETQRAATPLPTSKPLPNPSQEAAHDALGESPDSDDPMPQTPSLASSAGPIGQDGIAPTPEVDEPLTDSFDDERPGQVAGFDPPLDVSSQERSQEKPKELTHDEPQAAPDRTDHSEVRPTWFTTTSEPEAGHPPIELHTSETDSPATVEAEAPTSEEPDGSVLPTEAIKRYLAAFSGTETGVQNGSDNTEPTSEHEASERDAADSADQEIALTEVLGIGPALSTALGQLGVGDVRDLAELDSDDLDYLEEQLGRFGPRIRSGRWVEQARKLINDE